MSATLELRLNCTPIAADALLTIRSELEGGLFDAAAADANADCLLRTLLVLVLVLLLLLRPLLLLAAALLAAVACGCCCLLAAACCSCCADALLTVFRNSIHI
eukprot:SAG11_NODE_13646_length_645_cov_1.335165_2_plen_103_part_00